MTYDERTSHLQAAPAPPKLLIERRAEGPVTCLRLSGMIDEQFDGPGLARTVAARFLILDLGGIDRISSFGIRQWIDFVTAAVGRVSGLYFVECSPKIVDQFNMVANFGGSGHIVSFYAPYRCDTCDHDRRRLFRTDEETPLWRAGQAPAFACPTCGNQEYFDEDPATYFSSVSQQSQVTLPPEVSSFLRTQLSYGQGGQRKLKIEKRVDGRLTHVKLSGDLDSDLRAQKLAEGLEGEVVFDLAGVLSIDPVGAAQWRKLMHFLESKSGDGERVDRVHLLGVPAPFMERLLRLEDLTRKGQVLSVLVPYNCPRCRATTQRLVDFAQHGAELRAGRVPRTACMACGSPAGCVVSETWLARLTALPAPQQSDELGRSLSRISGTPSRANLAPGVAPFGAPAAWPPQPVTTQPAAPLPIAPESTAKQPGSAQTPRQVATRDMPQVATGLVRILQVPGLVPGLLVVLLAISGAFVIRILLPQDAPSSRGGQGQVQVIDRSQTPPPAWRNAPSTDAVVGQSSLWMDRKSAEEQAEAAALVEVANRLATELARDPQWSQAMAPLYAAAQKDAVVELRDGTGGPAPAATSTDRKEALARAREGQRRIASSLRATSAETPSIQTYWERLSQGEKSGSLDLLYRAFCRVEIKRAALDRLVAQYGNGEVVQGVHVLPYFPLLSWRFALVSGAVVTEVEPQSPLAVAGLSAGDIVVFALGQEIRGPADLVRVLTKMAADGSAGLLKVARGDRLVELPVTSARHSPIKARSKH